MPTYEIDGPDGKTYEIDGPPGATREQIIAKVKAGIAAAPQPAAAKKPEGMGLVDTAIDMARSVPGGLAHGASMMAGAPGDLRDMSAAITGKLAGMMGGDPAQAKEAATNNGNRMLGSVLGLVTGDPSLMNVPAPLPGAAVVDETLGRPTGGYYKPKSVPGEYAQTTASFAANALMPGSWPQRALSVLGPGIGSETAGQLTKGKSYEPLARAGGALVGGIGAGMAGGAIARLKNPPPSMEQLGEAKTAAYKAAEQAGVVITPDSFQKFATDLGADITKNNVVQADIHKNALSALSVIQDEAATGVPMSLERADLVRQAVNGAIEKASGANGSGADLRMAQKVKASFDHYLDNLSPMDTVSGDPAVAVPILKEARSLAQREFKAKEIQKIIDLAENQAAGNNSAIGKGQALHQQFKNLNAQLIKDPSYAKTFSDAERAAIEKVVNGGAVENALRLFGKLAPTNAISMGVAPSLGATGGAFLGGPVGAGIGAVALPAAGAAARGGASLLTQRNAKLAEELMRAGAPVNPGATALPRNLLLGQLLSQGIHR